MGKTKSLNSDDTVYVTTYFGGEHRGRSYAITVNIDGSQVQADNGVRPVFDS